METFELIKKIRMDNKLTQAQFGGILNCDRYRIADIERGKAAPTIEDIKVLSKKFNISADYLLGLTDVSSVDTNIKMICEYTGLSEKSVKEISSTYGSNSNMQNFSEQLETLLFDTEATSFLYLQKKGCSIDYNKYFNEYKLMFNNTFSNTLDIQLLLFKYLNLAKRRYNNFHGNDKYSFHKDKYMEKDLKLVLFDIQEYSISLAKKIASNFNISYDELKNQYLSNIGENME